MAIRLILTLLILVKSPSLLSNTLEGIIDLRSKNLQDHSEKIQGQWHYFWGKHVNPSQMKGEGAIQPDGLFRVPGLWNDTKIYLNNPSEIVTYEYTILLKPIDERLRLTVPEIPSAYKMWVNGKLKIENGILGLDRDSTTPGGREQVVEIPPKTESLEIVVQVSNFHHKDIGIRRAFSIASETVYLKDKLYEDLESAILFGWILFMGLYHIILYILRPQSKAPAFFGLYCLMVSTRIGVVGGDGIIFYIFPDIGWHFGKRLEYWSFFLSLPAFVSFISGVFEEDFYSWLRPYSWCLGGRIFTSHCLYRH